MNGARGRGAVRAGALFLALTVAACSDDAGDPDAAAAPRVDAAAASDAALSSDDAGRDDAAPTATLDAGDRVCAACDGSCEEVLALEPAAHRAGAIDYADKPPAGGPHAPCWANYEVYVDAPLPAEQWVHNLEHGAVVFLYHCPDGCDAELAQLIALGLTLPRTIVTEYPQMPAGFAAVSWGHRLVSACYDGDALRAFYAAHFDNAPESVSSGRPGGC